MQTRKFLTLTTSVIFVLFSLFFQYEKKVQAQVQPQLNVRESLFEKDPVPLPLKITNYEFGKGNSKIDGLTIEVQNISAKAIYFFRYSIIVQLPIAQGKPPVGYQLMYNGGLQIEAEVNKSNMVNKQIKALLPGQMTKLSLPTGAYKGLVNIIEKQYSLRESDIVRVDFTLQNAYYGNGSGWSLGNEYPTKDVSKYNPNPTSSLKEIDKVSYKPEPLSGCSTCSGACSGYTQTSSCLRYDTHCKDYVIDYGYTQTHPGSTRPSPILTTCPNGTDQYLQCLGVDCTPQ